MVHHNNHNHNNPSSSSSNSSNSSNEGAGNTRRKNATRETTATLKAWLYEHRKNPYPTKGEKIMLAIITKMSLNQVSTWFANARRRLKKENKMSFSPRANTNGAKNVDSDSDDMPSSKHGGHKSSHKSGNNKLSGSTSSDNMNMDDLDDLDDINDEELEGEDDEDDDEHNEDEDDTANVNAVSNEHRKNELLFWGLVIISTMLYKYRGLIYPLIGYGY